MQVLEKRQSEHTEKTICFIKPPYNAFMEELDPPFALMYLAAVAEKCGWQAEILDMKSLNDNIPEANIYGVTSSSPQWPDTVKLSEILSDKFSVVGGNHISALPSDVKKTQFDIAVVGEGEIALEKILHENLATHKHSIIFGRPVENIDNIPFPARHLVDWNKYKRGIYWGKTLLEKAVSIISSRGCPFSCVYCGSKVVFGRHTRFRSIENVVAEVKQVIETMGYRGFNWHDDTFCLNKKRVIDLCGEFEKLDIVWRCLSRVDTVDEEVLGAMQKSGCKELILGVESGSQKILNNLRKGTTVEQNLKAMSLVKENGIQLKVGIIIGSPGETWETVKETEELLKACPPDFWNVSCFTPFPGAYVWDHSEELGIKILTRKLSDYAMVGVGYKGNVVVKTEEMKKEDIEQARDRLIDLLLDISGANY